MCVCVCVRARARYSCTTTRGCCSRSSPPPCAAASSSSFRPSRQDAHTHFLKSTLFSTATQTHKHTHTHTHTRRRPTTKCQWQRAHRWRCPSSSTPCGPRRAIGWSTALSLTTALCGALTSCLPPLRFTVHTYTHACTHTHTHTHTHTNKCQVRCLDGQTNASRLTPLDSRL